MKGKGLLGPWEIDTGSGKQELGLLFKEGLRLEGSRVSARFARDILTRNCDHPQVDRMWAIPEGPDTKMIEDLGPQSHNNHGL